MSLLLIKSIEIVNSISETYEFHDEVYFQMRSRDFYELLVTVTNNKEEVQLQNFTIYNSYDENEEYLHVHYNYKETGFVTDNDLSGIAKQIKADAEAIIRLLTTPINGVQSND